MTSTDELENQIHAQDCELEYWFQQAENYAEVQIPADDLRAIIARTYAAVNALPELLERVRRYESALHEVIGLDHHNMGPESRATKIARAALNQEPAQ